MNPKPRQYAVSVVAAVVTMFLFLFATENLPPGGRATIAVVFVFVILAGLVLGAAFVALRKHK